MNEAEILAGCLHDIGAIMQKQKQKDNSTSASYNIFNVIHMESNETSVHSAFIADLLNPNGHHSCGDKFLAAFINNVSKKFNFSTEGARVEIEKYIGPKTKTSGGRIDIIITNKEKKAIIIENKIYAVDQEDQLIRYTNYAKDIFKEYLLLYLTLDGHEASESSAKSNGQEVEYRCISYRDHIRAWLEECKRSEKERYLLASAIEHYVNLIKKLTHTDMKENIKSEMIDRVISDPNNIENLNNFITVLNYSKKKLLETYWEKLYTKIFKEHTNISVFTKEKGEYQRYDGQEISMISRKFEFYGFRKGYDFQFGIQLPVGTPLNGEQLMMGIIVDGALSMRAYVIDENGKTVRAGKTNERFHKLMESSDEKAKKWIKEDGIFVWASYFSSDDSEWNFYQLPDKTLKQLAQMESFIEDTVRAFEEKLAYLKVSTM